MLFHPLVHGERQNILDILFSRKQHDQPVEAECHPGAGRKSELQRVEQLFIHGIEDVFVVIFFLLFSLESFSLFIRVGEFGVTVCQFHPGDVEFGAFRPFRIFLLSFGLFWNLFLTFLGVFFLIFGGIGILIARRIVSSIKRANPEAFEALRAEARKRREKEKTVDLPLWIMILLGVATLVGVLGEIGAFRFNPFLDSLLLVLLIIFLIYYFLYKRKVRNKQYAAKTESSSSSS